jgi:Thioredoxin reductase
MKTDYDVIVVGAGPAGITASIYLKRANLNIAIIEKDAPGGQLNKSSTIENYPGFDFISGPDLAYKFYDQIKKMNIELISDEVKDIIDKGETKEVVLKNRTITCKKIILALGRKPKKLERKNEEDLEGKGISFCSLCDGYLYKGEDVSIVGGGNSALEEALYLSKICKSVTIINRTENLRGDKILIDKVLNTDNINMIYNAEVSKFNGENGVLESIDIKEKDEIINLKTKACFIFIGYEPDTDFLKKLDILDEMGYIITTEEKETKVKGIYAAGDVVKKDAYQIVTAASDGALAAIACTKELGK